jgi:hypothetical protein
MVADLVGDIGILKQNIEFGIEPERTKGSGNRRPEMALYRF